jgi:hypothetical protein
MVYTLTRQFIAMICMIKAIRFFLLTFCSYSGNSKKKICSIVILDFFPKVCSRKIIIFVLQTNRNIKINIVLFQELKTYFCPEKEFSTAGEVFLKI